MDSRYLIEPSVIENCPINAMTEINGGYVLRIEVDNLNERPLQSQPYPPWPIGLRLATFFPKVLGRVIEPTISWIRFRTITGKHLAYSMAAKLPKIDFGSFKKYHLETNPIGDRDSWFLTLAQTPFAIGFINFLNHHVGYMHGGDFEIKIKIPRNPHEYPEIFIGRTVPGSLSVRECYSFGVITHPFWNSASSRQVKPEHYSIIGGCPYSESFIRDPYAWTHHDLDKMSEMFKSAYPSSWSVRPF